MSFNEVSDCAGCEPFKTIVANTRQIRLGAPEYSWILEEEYSGSDERSMPGIPWEYPAVIVPFNKLYNRIASNANNIRQLAQTKNLNIDLVFIVNSSNESLPYLELSLESLEQLVALGASVEFDIYSNTGDRE
jgi:hypothetical protein